MRHPPILTPDSFSPLLKKLVFTPDKFDAEDTDQAFHHLLSGSSALPEQVSSFLTALHFTKVDKESDVLVAAAAVLHHHAVQVEVDGPEDDFIVDIVGTGGDGWNTFNVSTTAAIVAAGAGARLIKVCTTLLALRSSSDISHVISMATRPRRPSRAQPTSFGRCPARSYPSPPSTPRPAHPKIRALSPRYPVPSRTSLSSSFSRPTTTPPYPSSHLRGASSHSAPFSTSSVPCSTPPVRRAWSSASPTPSSATCSRAPCAAAA